VWPGAPSDVKGVQGCCVVGLLLVTASMRSCGRWLASVGRRGGVAQRRRGSGQREIEIWGGKRCAVRCGTHRVSEMMVTRADRVGHRGANDVRTRPGPAGTPATAPNRRGHHDATPR
jgi:hypothetical protein